MSFICGIFWRLRVNNWLVLNPLIVQYVCDCHITPFLNVKKHVRTFVFDKHIQTVHNPSRIFVPIQCTSIKFKLKNHSFFVFMYCQPFSMEPSNCESVAECVCGWVCTLFPIFYLFGFIASDTLKYAWFWHYCNLCFDFRPKRRNKCSVAYTKAASQQKNRTHTMCVCRERVVNMVQSWTYAGFPLDAKRSKILIAYPPPIQACMLMISIYG